MQAFLCQWWTRPFAAGVWIMHGFASPLDAADLVVPVRASGRCSHDVRGFPASAWNLPSMMVWPAWPFSRMRKEHRMEVKPLGSLSKIYPVANLMRFLQRFDCFVSAGDRRFGDAMPVRCRCSALLPGLSVSNLSELILSATGQSRFATVRTVSTGRFRRLPPLFGPVGVWGVSLCSALCCTSLPVLRRFPGGRGSAAS